MNLFNFLSSPLKKQQPELPSTMASSQPATRTFSPRDRRASQRASNQFDESGSRRSSRSRRSDVSTTSIIDSTTIISSTMPPPPKNPKRSSMGNTHSSPAARLSAAGRRASASSPQARVRSSPRNRTSPELGEAPSGRNSSLNSPAALPESPAMSTTGTPASASSSVSRSRQPRKTFPLNPHFHSTKAARETREQPASFMAVNSPPAPSPAPSTRDTLPIPSRTQSRRSLTQASPKAQEVEQVESEQEEADDEDSEHEFKRIMDHRWFNDKFELRIEWSDGERTWTDEEIIHEDCPEALFEYWRSLPRGRPNTPDDEGVYHVFAIRKHRTHRGKKQVLVEWLGYEESDQTWENQEYIESVAKEHVDEYMKSVKGKGRPSKGKAKAAPKPKVNKKGTAKPVRDGQVPIKAAVKSATPAEKARGNSRVTKRRD
ncbi:uncharacterized protein B0J16DRAFT_418639 [Fusarium flagelliforme]|uniref:uncharacterized protein n=1 Tax=Fusarium flagelliforme TaxID=2675880 RepID=UPI001E8DB3CA|nr:uncharacterized protein B0J16DRAFT_418639 [Fusarium flagelliforme]KAH7173333.1 hypothetical protein B0J16DRAFT_418639 [Fusarium flagelliforme]